MHQHWQRSGIIFHRSASDSKTNTTKQRGVESECNAPAKWKWLKTQGEWRPIGILLKRKCSVDVLGEFTWVFSGKLRTSQHTVFRSFGSFDPTLWKYSDLISSVWTNISFPCDVSVYNSTTWRGLSCSWCFFWVRDRPHRFLSSYFSLRAINLNAPKLLDLPPRFIKKNTGTLHRTSLLLKFSHQNDSIPKYNSYTTLTCI